MRQVGAERVLVDIANSLSEMYDITVFSIYDKGMLKAELNSVIHFKSVYNKRFKDFSWLMKKLIPLKFLLFKNKLYKKYLKGLYDVEISFLEGPITRLFSCKDGKEKKITWVHNDISQVFGANWLARIKMYIDKNVYKNFNNIIFVSEDNMLSFKKLYPMIDKEKMKLIYNFIDYKSIIRKGNTNIPKEFISNKKIKFISVCRLVEQKALDRLIKVHKRLIEEGFTHTIYIIGDGPEKSKLEELIRNNNVEDTFRLLGQKDNPYPYIKFADYFCLFSNYEGYGMVIDEAKIFSKKIVITNTAAREALKGYSNSLIVENSEEGIFEGIKSVITNQFAFKNCDYNAQIAEDKRLQQVIKLIDE